MEELVLRAQGCDLAKTLSCGQAFRWQEKDGWWQGVVRDRPVRIRPVGKCLILCAPPKERAFWRRYFSLDRDYSEMEALLAADPKTAHCLPYSKGIRILRQDPYEALISFILSANNNVKRIAGIIERLCACLGREIEGPFGPCYAFPEPERLAGAEEAQLLACGAGYRAPYVIESAARIASGFRIKTLARQPFEEARRALLNFPGVGPKVAECVMLFSLGFDQALPVDVWVRRISRFLYPGQEGKEAARAAALRFGPWAGAAQQYLFHYARQTGLKEE